MVLDTTTQHIRQTPQGERRREAARHANKRVYSRKHEETVRRGKMPGYVSGGTIREQKHETAFSFGYVADSLWSVLNQVGFFFSTMVSLEATDAYVSGANRRGTFGSGSNTASATSRNAGGVQRPPNARRGVHGMNTVRGMSHNAAVGGG